MTSGRGGIGSYKHYVSGHSGKSPKMRHAMKMEAERSSVKDKSRIRDPKGSVTEVFRRKKP